MIKRDIGQEILESIRSIKRGEGKRYSRELEIDIKSLRGHLKLSQARFALMLGISPRTLQDWEQGRRRPTGSAYALLHMARKHPDIFLEDLKDRFSPS